MSTSRPSPAHIARELKDRLQLNEGVDDFSLVQPLSVVCSLEQLSARDTDSGGEFFSAAPNRHTGSLPGSFPGGGVGREY